MEFKEINKNLFDLEGEYTLVHCISKDCEMGAGIAKEFVKRYPGIKDHNKEAIKNMGRKTILDGINIFYKKDNFSVISIVTKGKFWSKPTIDSMQAALTELKFQCFIRNINKLAMPTIGCGLDKLKWKTVKQLIKDTFEDMDLEIVICHK